MYNFKSLKVCFIGVGSIASKHICNLKKICEEEHITLKVDALRRSTGANESDAVIRAMAHVDAVYHDVKQLPEDYDVIFITNPTDFHIEVLNSVSNKAKAFFIEKPVVSVARLNEAEQFEKREGCVYYIACPMRYTGVLSYIKNNIDVNRVSGVRSISSSYLPNWRPGTDYRKCYSAIKALGGGVAIDLIHEWDYLTYLFGFPEDVKSILAKKSTLEIDSEDYATYIAEYPDKIVELHLDYFGRKTLREIMIFTDEDTIVGDFTKGRVSYLNEGRTLEFNDGSSDVGCRELRHFLDIIDGKCECDNDMENAIRTLKLTQGVI